MIVRHWFRDITCAGIISISITVTTWIVANSHILAITFMMCVVRRDVISVSVIIIPVISMLFISIGCVFLPKFSMASIWVWIWNMWTPWVWWWRRQRSWSKNRQRFVWKCWVIVWISVRKYRFHSYTFNWMVLTSMSSSMVMVVESRSFRFRVVVIATMYTWH